MLKSKLTYFLAKLSTKFPFHTNRTRFYRDLMAGETLNDIRQLYKNRFGTEQHVTLQQYSPCGLFGKTVMDVIRKYGKPVFVHRCRKGGISHEILVYTITQFGLPVRVVYNFINHRLATASFKYSIKEPADTVILKDAIYRLYQLRIGQPLFCVMDKQGNRLVYEEGVDVKVTYVNMNKEIGQIINLGAYNETYSQEKYQYTRGFQLSV